MRKLLDYSFAIVIVVIIIGAVFLLCSMVAHRNVEPYTKVIVQVTEPVVLKDTLGREVLLMDQSVSTLDSLVYILNSKSAEIDYKYELFIKSREKESNLIEILASIVALILGVLSFLGIRSIKDIEEEVKESAQKIAKEQADASTTSILERIATTKIQEIAQKYYDTQYRDKLTEDIKKAVYRDYISAIEDKLSSKETLSEDVREENVEESPLASQESDIIVNPELSDDERLRMNRLTNNE